MKDAIFAFARAVFWGSLAGGGPFVLLIVPLVLRTPDWWRADVIWVALMPLAVAGAVVTSAAALFGLPLTAWLARQHDEDRMSYVMAGLGLGALLPICLILALFEDWQMGAILALPGAFAGTVTGASWGGWRERIVDQRTHP